MAVVRVLLALACWSDGGREGHSSEEDWRHIATMREVYLSAVEKAMTSGLMDSGSLEQVVGTCGAPAWYRKYLLGYENMLRSLDTTFSDLTLPYWDIFEDSAKRITTTTECNGVEGCSPILEDLGGCTGPELMPGEYVVNAAEVREVYPARDWTVGDSSLEFGPTTFADLIRHASDANGTSSSGSPKSIQMTLHSILGGVYETRAAAFDPIFLILTVYLLVCSATLDMVSILPELQPEYCSDRLLQGHGDVKISPTATIPMKIKSTAVEKHADLGAFFKNVGTNFKSMDAFACNTKKSATGAISYATAKSTFEDAAGINTLVNDLVACDQTSKMNGTTTEAASAFISCQLLSSLQNGVFTNDDLPKCVGDLAAITTVEVTVTPSSTCQKAIYKDTSISTKTDFNTVTDGFAIVTRGAQDGNVRYMNPPLDKCVSW
ncbi:putative domain, di-copper centre [Phytophthora cactorum]|nr:putative domain, di-copper centre [Phytophthora cactorum]